MTRPAWLTADDRGDTLVELLVALVIMGLVFVVVLAGIGVALAGAAGQRRLTTFNAALATAAANLAAARYVACARPTSYDLGPSPQGYRVSVSSVRYWNGVDGFVADCAQPDNGLQLLTVDVAQDDDTASTGHTRTIVKRDGA